MGALLTDADVDVIDTRSDGGRSYGNDRDLTDYSATFADLEERIAIANQAKADLFVSIHSNSFDDPRARHRGLLQRRPPLRGPQP
ncbi:MAG: N-acetylmuramoyl-L-alanine amidase [Dehalococcoidia bacterium]|nr:N-acetylmuramoyl-L-alanine amidase [Dehalococcoidia bacterium]